MAKESKTSEQVAPQGLPFSTTIFFFYSTRRSSPDCVLVLLSLRWDGFLHLFDDTSIPFFSPIALSIPLTSPTCLPSLRCFLLLSHTKLIPQCPTDSEIPIYVSLFFNYSIPYQINKKKEKTHMTKYIGYC